MNASFHDSSSCAEREKDVQFGYKSFIFITLPACMQAGFSGCILKAAIPLKGLFFFLHSGNFYCLQKYTDNSYSSFCLYSKVSEQNFVHFIQLLLITLNRLLFTFVIVYKSAGEK
jgi:hypothetical protein